MVEAWTGGGGGWSCLSLLPLPLTSAGGPDRLYPVFCALAAGGRVIWAAAGGGHVPPQTTGLGGPACQPRHRFVQTWRAFFCSDFARCCRPLITPPSQTSEAWKISGYSSKLRHCRYFYLFAGLWMTRSEAAHRSGPGGGVFVQSLGAGAAEHDTLSFIGDSSPRSDQL